jgi:hypothetical protein
MGAPHNKPLSDLASAEQDAEVVQLKRQGFDFREIGTRLGISKSQVHRAFHRALQRIVEPEVLAYRAEQLVRIALEREEALDIMGARHIVVSNGHIVSEITGTDSEGDPIYGEPLTDPGPTLAAIDRLIKLDDQEAKLLGLYADTKVNLTGGVRYEVVGIDPADLS